MLSRVYPKPRKLRKNFYIFSRLKCTNDKSLQHDMNIFISSDTLIHAVLILAYVSFEESFLSTNIFQKQNLDQ